MAGTEAGASGQGAETRIRCHQWANFELNHPGGDIGEADRLAREAALLDPRNKSIKHTQAGIARRRALLTDSPLLRQQLRRLARDRLDEAHADHDSHILSTRSKVIVDEIEDLASSLSDPPPPQRSRHSVIVSRTARRS